MKAPRTLADVIREQGTDALQRGEASMAADDIPAALAWFERAYRFVPKDPSVAASLAGVLLRLGDARATGLFAEVAEKAETREVLLGLAASAWQSGSLDVAQAAMARLLGHYVLPADRLGLGGLADAICVHAKSPGWCGVSRTARGDVIWLASIPDAVATVDGLEVHGAALPDIGRWLHVAYGGKPLLGSPVDLRLLRRIEGFVDADGLGVAGWAWYPADADSDPWLSLQGSCGKDPLEFQARSLDITTLRPLTRPRAFRLSARELDGRLGPYVVSSLAGGALTGSPVDPTAPIRAAQAMARHAAEECPALTDAPSGLPEIASQVAFSAPADIDGPPAAAMSDPQRPVAVVIPVYRSLALTIGCIDSVVASAAPGCPIIVVDDATPEPALAAELDARAKAGQIILLRHATNLGFPASANAGLRAAFALTPPHDALLLNSDTLVPPSRGPSWLARLRAAVHSAPDIGTAAPLSNDATLLSYPDRDGGNALSGVRALARLDSKAAQANPGVVVDLPTSVGFCMYVRRECAIETGLFRTSLFAQGYGEENDFCIRARHLGWRSVAVPGVFVAHLGGASFGDSRSPLMARNSAVMERVHPGYHALIMRYLAAVPSQDALAPARRRLDAVRWAAGRAAASVILVTHDSGGGVERAVQRRVREIDAAGLRAIVLRPVADPDSDGGCLPGLCRVERGSDRGGFPNLVFDLPREMTALVRLLRADRPALLEVHHLLGHAEGILDLAARLAVPTEQRVHDYAAFCPRITLVGPDRRYCGEPDDVAVCEACVADAGDRILAPGAAPRSVADLRAGSARHFAAARRVVVPSADMAARLRRHFPSVRADVVPHEDDRGFPMPPPRADVWPRRVCIIGAISTEKGFDVLLACVRDAAARDLPLEFILVGHSVDDARLMRAGRIFVTGGYLEADADRLIRAQGAHLAFLPSIIPETWGFTLGLAWQAGLQTVAFDIGAIGARIRASGRGTVLPLGLSAAGINNALMAP